MHGYRRFPTAPSPGGLVITTIVSLLVVLAALDRLQHSLQLRALPRRHVTWVAMTGRCTGLASVAFRDHLPAGSCIFLTYATATGQVTSASSLACGTGLRSTR